MVNEKITKVIWHLKNSIETGRIAMIVINSLRENYQTTKEERDDLFLTSLYQGLLSSVILSLANFSKQDGDSINFRYLVNCIKNNRSEILDNEYVLISREIERFECKMRESTKTLDSIIMIRDTTIAHLDRKHINNSSSLEIPDNPHWDDIAEIIRVIGEGLDKLGIYFGQAPCLPIAKVNDPYIMEETRLIFDTIYNSKFPIRN